MKKAYKVFCLGPTSGNRMTMDDGDGNILFTLKQARGVKDDCNDICRGGSHYIRKVKHSKRTCKCGGKECPCKCEGKECPRLFKGPGFNCGKQI